MAPDLRRKVDAARAARLAREGETKKLVQVQVSPNPSSAEHTCPQIYTLIGCHYLLLLLIAWPSSLLLPTNAQHAHYLFGLRHLKCSVHSPHIHRPGCE